MVFLPTARLTQFAAEAMRHLAAELPEIGEVGEIHSKKSPSAREKSSDDFRAATTAVLLSSDVSARGVDYPDVTFVLQVGAPTSKAQYVHRVGRTGRGSSEAAGRGLLLLCDFEARFLSAELAGEPIRRADAEVGAGCAEPAAGGLAARDLAARGAAAVGDALAAQTYAAFLSHYANLKKLTGLDKDGLVAAAALFATQVLRRAAAPAVPATLVGTLGLKGAAGLLVEGEAAPGGGGGGGGGVAALTPEQLAEQKVAAKAEKAAAVRAAKAEAGLKAKAAAEARRAAAAEAEAAAC